MPTRELLHSRDWGVRFQMATRVSSQWLLVRQYRCYIELDQTNVQVNVIPVRNFFSFTLFLPSLHLTGRVSKMISLKSSSPLNDLSESLGNPRIDLIRRQWPSVKADDIVLRVVGVLLASYMVNSLADSLVNSRSDLEGSNGEYIEYIERTRSANSFHLEKSGSLVLCFMIDNRQCLLDSVY